MKFSSLLKLSLCFGLSSFASAQIVKYDTFSQLEAKCADLEAGQGDEVPAQFVCTWKKGFYSKTGFTEGSYKTVDKFSAKFSIKSGTPDAESTGWVSVGPRTNHHTTECASYVGWEATLSYDKSFAKCSNVKAAANMEEYCEKFVEADWSDLEDDMTRDNFDPANKTGDAVYRATGKTLTCGGIEAPQTVPEPCPKRCESPTSPESVSSISSVSGTTEECDSPTSPETISSVSSQSFTTEECDSPTSPETIPSVSSQSFTTPDTPDSPTSKESISSISFTTEEEDCSPTSPESVSSVSSQSGTTEECDTPTSPASISSVSKKSGTTNECEPCEANFVVDGPLGDDILGASVRVEQTKHTLRMYMAPVLESAPREGTRLAELGLQDGDVVFRIGKNLVAVRNTLGGAQADSAEVLEKLVEVASAAEGDVDVEVKRLNKDTGEFKLERYSVAI